MLQQLIWGLSSCHDLQVYAVFFNEGKLAEQVANLGIDVRIFNESSHSIIALSQMLRSVIRELCPDIIHSHRYKENFLAWFASRGIGKVRFVATQHGMPEPVGYKASLKSRLWNSVFFRLLSHGFHRTVVVSQEMKKELIGSYGFRSNNVSVIHNGISIPSDHLHTPTNRLVIGSAGRLFPVKDFSLMVDIAERVLKKTNTVDFVLAGEGPQRVVLEEKIRHYGLQDRFMLVGHQSDMGPFYKGLDVYINTSMHEGIPMSVLEAMSYGLPVIAPKVGGFPEIIEDGVSGFLVDTRDPLGFAGRCLDLLHSERRNSMGRASRQRVQDCFSREAMARQYYQLYSELLAD